MLTDKLANQIYEYSGGIPAYITKIFEEAQVRAIMDGADMINGRYIQAAVDYLSIKPPREYERGNFISDFKVGLQERTEAIETIEVNVSESKEKRLYANPRGRKAQKREERDIICGFKAGTLHEMLLNYGMLEEIVLC